MDRVTIEGASDRLRCLGPELGVSWWAHGALIHGKLLAIVQNQCVVFPSHGTLDRFPDCFLVFAPEQLTWDVASTTSTDTNGQGAVMGDSPLHALKALSDKLGKEVAHREKAAESILKWVANDLISRHSSSRAGMVAQLLQRWVEQAKIDRAYAITRALEGNLNPEGKSDANT